MIIMDDDMTAVDDATPTAQLLALAGDCRAIIDVTNLDLNRLPVRVQASLYSENAFSARRLETVRHLYIPNPTTVDAPKLRAAGDIYVPKVEEALYFPELVIVRDIVASSTCKLCLPLVVTAGNIKIRSERVLVGPMYSIRGHVGAVQVVAHDQPSRPADARKFIPLGFGGTFRQLYKAEGLR